MVSYRRDLVATVLTALAVLVFAASHEGWSVWLVGDSHRWAAAAILLLGIGACAQGETTDTSTTSRVLAVLGGVALVLAVLTIVTASLTALSLLTAAVVVLWVVSTLRHRVHLHHRVPA